MLSAVVLSQSTLSLSRAAKPSDQFGGSYKEQEAVTQIVLALRPSMFSRSTLGTVTLKFASGIFRFRGRGSILYHLGSNSVESTFA